MRGSTLSLSALVAVAARLCTAQTFSDCNPMQRDDCPPSQGLNQASYSVDLTSGVPDKWSMTSGALKTSPKGGLFQITSPNDGPTIASDFYIFFGSVEVTMQAAPGSGIVSTYVMESMDLDEIDVEIIGSETTRIQSNYFGKGNTTTYDRGQYHPVNSPQTSFHTYKVDWRPDTTQWFVDGQLVRTLHFADAVGGKNYPQTPINVRIGNWVAGRPGNNAGTIQWAGGLANFDNAPFNMYVTKVNIENYNPCAEYVYSDRTGNWQSIKCKGSSGTNPQSSGSSSAKPTSIKATSSSAPVTTSKAPVTTSPAPVYSSQTSTSSKAPVYSSEGSSSEAPVYSSESSISSEAPYTTSTSAAGPSKTPCPEGNSTYVYYPHSSTSTPVDAYPQSTSSSSYGPIANGTTPCPEHSSTPAMYPPHPAPTTLTVQPVKPSKLYTSTVAPMPPPYSGGSQPGNNGGSPPPPPPPAGGEGSSPAPSGGAPPPQAPPSPPTGGLTPPNGGTPPSEGSPPNYGSGSGSAHPPPPPPPYQSTPVSPIYGGGAAPNGTTPAPSGSSAPHPANPMPSLYTGGATAVEMSKAMGIVVTVAMLIAAA